MDEWKALNKQTEDYLVDWVFPGLLLPDEETEEKPKKKKKKDDGISIIGSLSTSDSVSDPESDKDFHSDF